MNEENRPKSEEKWVGEVLGSLQGAARAEIPADLFENAMKRAGLGRAKVVRMSRAAVWGAAACGALLLLANAWVMGQYWQPRNSPSEAIAVEYFNIIDAPPM